MAIRAKQLKQQKIDAINTIKEKLKTFNDFIFTNFRGIKFAQLNEIRRQLREKNATYQIIKNNITGIAFSELQYPDISKYLIGPTAIVYTKENTGPVVKILLDLSKEIPLQVKGGLVDKNIFDTKQLDAFSKLPTKLELIAQLMSCMKAPTQNFVYILNAVPTKLVRVLQAVADKKNSEGQ